MPLPLERLELLDFYRVPYRGTVRRHCAYLLPAGTSDPAEASSSGFLCHAGAFIARHCGAPWPVSRGSQLALPLGQLRSYDRAASWGV